MTQKIVFATNNVHKTAEVANILAPQYQVLNLKDIHCLVDIPETGNTFAENASLKSSYVYQNYHLDCFADDSGLEVDALNNAPGIFSARYSGIKDDSTNLQLLLKNMEGKSDRKARFKTVISLLKNGENHLFEGVIEGTIRTEPAGSKGFGYDPIFQPNGYNITFAEMEMSEKNKISHRALAMQKLVDFLKEDHS
ncbi:non-canonical purine NTP diphosphatase [Pedobacter nanyangensis]|uniref:non-canonical purine NTP diphosphatase n=1 Tax=Pedobacter nanyangensis TaxID=1562389 RepID=UPI000DE260DC|nr:non-canonical purine NTP diphosphatase [Pedobacter nanyangensis]